MDDGECHRYHRECPFRTHCSQAEIPRGTTRSQFGWASSIKSLFETSMCKYAQLSFTVYHSAITEILLCILSRSRLAYFEARVQVLETLPVSIPLSMNAIVSNLSLAYLSAPFYQIVRALPITFIAAIKFFLYKATVPRKALMALMPMCMGLAVVTYYNPRDREATPTYQPPPLGAISIFVGVAMTAPYTMI